MKDLEIPYEKLDTFRRWLGLNEEELAALESLQDFFASRKEDFARHFHDFFMKIPDARFLIEHQERPGYLHDAWARWFESLFTKGLNKEFQEYLLKVGRRHVDVNLDQRFSNLGFSIVRQFCHRLILAEMPPEKAAEISCLVDRMIDYCVLVETHSYIEGTTRCDIEIMKGIADRIRNPVTVIGGHINRLMKKSGSEDPAFPVYEFISSQSTKCERMLRDIKTYLEIFEREPVFQKISLRDLAAGVIKDLFSRGWYQRPPIEMAIEDESSYILADLHNMKALFGHLIENALEALGDKDPLIKISSNRESARPHSLTVEIYNTGEPLKEEERERIFSPFYSTKPHGTGFGLSIVRQAARKNMGRISIEPVDDKGTKVVLSLPAYENRNDPIA